MSSDDQGQEYRIEVTYNHAIYQGHFPNQAVTPGVCMLQMLTDAVAHQAGHTVRLKKANQMKFLAMWTPAITDEVTLRLSTETMENGDILVKQAQLGTSEVVFFKAKAVFCDAR